MDPIQPGFTLCLWTSFKIMCFDTFVTWLTGKLNSLVSVRVGVGEKEMFAYKLQELYK